MRYIKAVATAIFLFIVASASDVTDKVIYDCQTANFDYRRAFPSSPPSITQELNAADAYISIAGPAE